MCIEEPWSVESMGKGKGTDQSNYSRGKNLNREKQVQYVVMKHWKQKESNFVKDWNGIFRGNTNYHALFVYVLFCVS